jgi:hypothetical protein
MRNYIRKIVNLKIKSWIVKISLLFIHFNLNSNLKAQHNNYLQVDSTANYFYRFDLGISPFHFITSNGIINTPHAYFSISKNKPNYKFTPSIGFFLTYTNYMKNETYYGKKYGYNEYYLTARLVKNNFPRKIKCNIYYGILIGGYYSLEGTGNSQIFDEIKITGLSICPIIGLDQKIIKQMRLFCELQFGAIFQNISQKRYDYNYIINAEASNEFGFYSYTPLLIGCSFIIK